VPVLTEWVAVLAVADTVEELDDQAGRLLRRVPDHGLVGRVDAHEGLAEQLVVPSGTWITGVAAPSRPELEDVLIAAADGLHTSPLLVGEYRVRRLAD
jgi:hypothetical protein